MSATCWALGGLGVQTGSAPKDLRVQPGLEHWLLVPTPAGHCVALGHCFLIYTVATARNCLPGLLWGFLRVVTGVSFSLGLRAAGQLLSCYTLCICGFWSPSPAECGLPRDAPQDQHCPQWGGRLCRVGGSVPSLQL